MMAISVCVNDAVLLLYMLLFKSCFGSSCDSSPPAFGGYQCITKIQNRFQISALFQS